MDPLSIATAAVGATKALYKASSAIYQFVQDAKIVDTMLENLRSEFESTARILELIKTRLRNPVHLIHARAQDHQDFLDIALASIQECDDTSTEIVAKIEEIGKGSTSMISRSMRRGRYMLIQKDILRAHTRLRDQKQNLQLLIQMLDILLAHQSAALLTEKVLPPLNSLQLLVENASKSRTEVYIHPTSDNSSLTLVTTNQSTIKDSYLDSPIEIARDNLAHNDYERDIPYKSTEETILRTPVQFTDNISDIGQEQGPNSSDVQMIQAFQARGESLLESKSYASAEKVFSNCLKMSEILSVEMLSSSLIIKAQFGLAVAFMHQEKWTQAKDLFTFLTQEEEEDLIRARSLYNLAQIYLAEHDIDGAYTSCLQARSEFQDVSDRLQCTRLLVLIAETNKDEASAAIYANGLPKDESSSWAALPFYRFTSKGHGLSVAKEIKALKEMRVRVQDPNTKGGDNMLINASYHGHLEEVKILLWQGVPLNRLSGTDGTRDRMTALMAAAKNGYTEITKLLLDAGADPDIGCQTVERKSRTNESALGLAMKSRSVSVVSSILEAMTPNSIEYYGALELAVYMNLDAEVDNGEGLLSVLLENKNFVKEIQRAHMEIISYRKALNKDIKNTPLNIAISYGAIKIVRKMIEAGFKPTDEEFAKAVQSGNQAMIQEVAKGMNH